MSDEYSTVDTNLPKQVATEYTTVLQFLRLHYSKIIMQSHNHTLHVY